MVALVDDRRLDQGGFSKDTLLVQVCAVTHAIDNRVKFCSVWQDTKILDVD